MHGCRAYPWGMTKRTQPLLLSLLLAGACFSTSGCRVTTHPVEPAALGRPASSDEMIARLDEPGPVEVETVIAADWQVERSGLLNLDHPDAEAAGLEDGDEPIQIAFHLLRHPQRGTYMVDTGVEWALHGAPGEAALGGIVASVMNLETMKIHVDTANYLARDRTQLAGVLLTHLHADHIAGLRDVPHDVPVYTGPGEADARSFLNLFVQPVANEALERKGPIRELPFEPDPAGRFAGVLDLLGDGSVWALLVPGHTDGSTAFLVRSTEGPVLLVGDACHTAWGWDHGVEPGTFSSDIPRSAESLAKLRQLVAQHPAIDVRLGHQPSSPRRPKAPEASASL